jgi:hypothetical protein
MGGGTTGQQTTQSTQTQQLPPWINDAAQQNYAYAQNVAMQPLQQYQGQLVPDVSPQMQQAWNTAATGANAGTEQFQGAEAGLLGALGQTPASVNPAQLSSTNLQPYMNPYTSSVINQTLPIMQQGLANSQNQQQNAANSANAYGGSRQAIQQGVTQSQGALNQAQMAAQLNQANFGQAQQGAQFDIGQRNQAQAQNQAAQQAAINSNIAASQGLTGLGNEAMMQQAANFTQQNTAGAEQEQYAQNAINAQLGQFQQAWNYPYQQLGVLQSALGQTPYGTMTTGEQQQTTSQPTDWAAIAGGGLSSLGSLFSAPAGGTSAASGFMNMLTGGGSDRRLKTDIKRVDTHPTGLPIYAYRYKGDPKSYPKVVGPMAEDVAKIAPHAVRPMGVGGRLAVHMPTLDALSPGNDNVPPSRAWVPGGQPPPGISLGRPGGGMGPLAGPQPSAGVGALGSPMAGRPGMRRPMPMPKIRGALGG